MANDASKGVPQRVKVRPFSNDEKPKKPTGRPRKKPKPKVFEQPENANGVTDKQAISMIRASILKDGIDPQKMMDIVSLCDRMLGNEDREYALTWTTWIKETAQKLHIKTRNEQYGVVYWDCVLSEARHHILDSYLLYLEKNRKPKDKFYQPRRKCFIKIGLVQALQDMIDDKLDILSISLPPSTGKALALDSMVYTPDGYVLNKDLNVGDKVLSASGEVSTVLGVYPQGKKRMYKLTLDDGSSCECSEDHLWTCRTRDDRRRNKSRTIPLIDMAKNLYVENGKRKNYSIDYVGRIDFTEKEQKLHPYILGYLIGNGNLQEFSISLSTQDHEVVDKINSLLPRGYAFNHYANYDYRLKGHEGNNSKCGSIVRKALTEYGLCGKRSYEKFIPDNYKYGSYEQRIELLRGLLDSDGYSSRTSQFIEYSTSSKELADDVVELVHSFGGYASKSKKENCSYTDKNGNKVNCRDSYRISISFCDDMDNPFWVERKSKNFKPKKRIKQRFVSSIEYVGEKECQCIYIDHPSHLYITDNFIVTHNTTIEKFFITGIAGWYPKDYNLFYSHSGDITRMFYDGCLDIMKSDEYTWQEIFLDVSVGGTNAKTEQIQVGGYKPFPSIQTTSVGAKNSGKVRASKYLMCDDLIGGIEEALNKNQLDKLWSIYSVDARQRKTVDVDQKPCKEIHIATRWSVLDVIGRLQKLYEGNDRCKFLAVPDINPKTGKSNFLYDYGALTEEFFRDQQMVMDEISYRCLYKNDPIEREGLLYHEDEIRTYFTLPEREPDAIVGVCDTKTTGTDYMVLPCFYQYGNDYYLVDCVCDDSSDFGVQQRRVADLILRNNMQQVEFESNAGGGRFALEVDKIVRESCGRCNITTKPTETNKETRIIVNSDWIKRNCLFKEKELYVPRSDYGRFMDFLFSYSVAGKNPHDDVVDALANFALNQTRSLRIAKVEAVVNPFRTRFGGFYE